MDPLKNHSLENFVERHRADFDVHEPRPDLWAALEQQLAEPTAPAAAPTMRMMVPAEAPVMAPAQPAVKSEQAWLQRYGVAAALALLVVAAGATEAWKSAHSVPAVAAAAPAALAPEAVGAPDAALYQRGNPLSMTAADRSTGADSQLVRAVRGMEAYYTNQLARRQEELRQLSGPGYTSMNADWQRELVSLDSSYRELKQQLMGHPQPDAVLTAMNRNLQIRLDILDQQLHLGTAPEAEPAPGGYVLADSRHLPE